MRATLSCELARKTPMRVVKAPMADSAGRPDRMDDYRDGLIWQRLAYTANCRVFSNGGDTGLRWLR